MDYKVTLVNDAGGFDYELVEYVTRPIDFGDFVKFSDLDGILAAFPAHLVIAVKRAYEDDEVDEVDEA